MACCDQIKLVSLDFMACRRSFMSGDAENIPTPSQNLDQDKQKCSTSCRGGEINPYFMHTVLIFVPNPQLSYCS